MHLLILLLLLLLLGPCFSYLPRQNMENEQLVDNLSTTLQMILRQTCWAYNMSTFISTSYKDQLPLNEQRLVESVLTRSFIPVVPWVLDKQLNEQLGLRTQMLLFFVQNANQLITACDRNPRMNKAHKYKFLVIMIAAQDDSAWQHSQMSQIFAYFLHYRYNVHALLLLAQLEAGTVSAFTYYPYSGLGICGSTQALPVLLHQGRIEQTYPRKLQNLNGCPLHVIVWQILPYMRLHMERTQPNDRISGIDAEILKLLANKLNFSLVLVVNEPAHLIGGSSFMNGTMTGAFYMLQQRQANLTLGFAACMAARYKYLSSTLPYSQVEYVLVMRKARPYSVYEVMLLPFDSHVWLLILVLTTLSLMCWESGWRRVPLLNLTWNLLIFLLRISYESSIFMFVHNAPSRPLPHSLEQALAQDYHFITDHATYRMTTLLPALRARTRILPGQPVDMFEQLLSQPEHHRVAIISNLNFVVDYLARRGEDPHRFVIASNKIIDNMICVHFPKGSYLTSNFNHMLFLMRSSGIGQHINNRLKSSHLATTLTTRLNPLQHSSDNVAQFNESMRLIYAALNCLMFAQSVTLAIFILELCSRRVRNRWLSRILERL